MPAAFRRILEADDPASDATPRARLYMVYGGKNRNFVECWSKTGADWLAAQIDAMELGSKARERAERDMISRSVMVEIEPEGRIVLPPQVRAKLGITDAAEAAFVGASNRFKLYRSDTYQAELDADDEDDEDAGLDALTLIGRAQKERGM
ncbi:division/cell wall cluster transcriptional repressor MraZ [Neotabrizicola sp. sgz301269]|uniref:division/cell wall cluster transcriptional repressor MraZ n=1 Tax=Neotabrizicola sp. sgz301269 TaxID=3276282 RepID=UPI00376FDC74